MAFKPTTAGNRRTIFVVEDDADYRTTLGEILTEEGFCAVLFGTAQKLLSSLNCDVPAVIVTDVVMPGVSGGQLLAALRENARWRAVPVVVMTGNNDTALPLRLDATVVCKPDTDELLREIFRVLGRMAPTNVLANSEAAAISTSPPRRSPP